YHFLRALGEGGLDVATPVAYGEERCGRWLVRSFLLTEGVPEAMPLDEFIVQVLPTMPSRQQLEIRHELIAQLATYVRRLHASGLRHQDLYWRNIVLSRPRLRRFFLIDAPKGHHGWTWTRRYRQAYDLATLDAPAAAFFRRTERLRFFLNYVGEEKLTPASKKLARLVLRLADRERPLQLQRVMVDRRDLLDEAVGL
ncbi:MAG: lipopolysaccharide kinase InaA family protein, partial [Acidiferrobacterales bacterium]